MIDYNSDFEFFWNKIMSGENFAFTRYADGEVLLMCGKKVGEKTQAYTVDKWMAPDFMTKLGEDLLSTLNHNEENYYYAISTPLDNVYDYEFLNSKIESKNKTYVNLWINANYIKTLKKFGQLKRDVILICNEKAKPENFPFNVSKVFTFPNDCVNFWENNGERYIENLKNSIGNAENQLFFISCGPASEVIIDKLYNFNPNNTYVDVGSSIDLFVHGYETRPYMDQNSAYSKMISSF